MILCKIDILEKSKCKRCCNYCKNTCEHICIFTKRNFKCNNQIELKEGDRMYRRSVNQILDAAMNKALKICNDVGNKKKKYLKRVMNRNKLIKVKNHR